MIHSISRKARAPLTTEDADIFAELMSLTTQRDYARADRADAERNYMLTADAAETGLASGEKKNESAQAHRGGGL